MRVGFVFNDNDNHQIAHAAPFAFALSRRDEVEVNILTSSASQESFTRRLATVHPGGHAVRFVAMRAPLWVEALDPVLRRWVFVRKSAVLRRNRARLLDYDALVCPEKTTQRMVCEATRPRPEFVLVMHGAGDRYVADEIGWKGCGLTLVSGSKQAERFARLPEGGDRRFAAVGSAKFAAVRAMTPKVPELFDNSRPTVPYNLRFCRKVSSYPDAGHAILDYFASQDRFNLIFAPHIVMFKRARRHGASPPRRFRDYPNIHIDLGSARSCDMSYVRSADIYLGDASSQVYEFLDTPRPCVLFDAHATPWTTGPHHLHWRFGQVITDIAGLDDALSRAQALHGLFRPVQQAEMSRTYAATDEAVAERGADAILDYLHRARATHGDVDATLVATAAQAA